MQEGEGTRLRPLTKVTNKHLIPLFDKPMILFPLETMKAFGIKDICIVTGGEHVADFMRFLGSGSEYGVNFNYKVQDSALGIANALLHAREFFGSDKAVVILGDNIFEKITAPQEAFSDEYAYIFVTRSRTPERFATVYFEGDIVTSVVEKPKQPKSDYIATGFYIFPNDVFDHIKDLKLSNRGEYEVTDIINWYLQTKRLKVVKLEGFWSDAGTLNSLLKASMWRAKSTNAEVVDDIAKNLLD